MLFLVFIYFALFTFCAWKNLRVAVGIFILSLPAYLIRFKIGHLPTTLLEVEWAAIAGAWAIRYARVDWPRIVDLVRSRPRFFCLLLAFFVASGVSVFVSGFGDSDYWHMTTESFGLWRAYFLEPMMLFFIMITRFGRDDSRYDWLWLLSFSTLSISVVALVQKFTGRLFAPSLWDDQLFGRVTSFFTTPNAIGLYVAPMIFLIGYLLYRQSQKYSDWRELSRDKIFWLLIGILLVDFLAIIFSFSAGALAGIALGALTGLFLIGHRRTTVVLTLFLIAIIFYIPDLRASALYQDRAGRNRLKLMSYTAEFLTARPANFIFGTGIRKFFDKIQKPHYVQKEMEPLLYPHNILLNFWTEIGLIGEVAFIGILGNLFYFCREMVRADRWLGASMASALVALTAHGFFDVPYFKNDLAFLFWILAFVCIIFIPSSRLPE